MTTYSLVDVNGTVYDRLHHFDVDMSEMSEMSEMGELGSEHKTEIHMQTVSGQLAQVKYSVKQHGPSCRERLTLVFHDGHRFTIHGPDVIGGLGITSLEQLREMIRNGERVTFTVDA